MSTSLAQEFLLAPPGRMILLYRIARVVRLPREILIKSGPPKGKATQQVTGNQIRTGNGTKKSLVKLEPLERENAKAKNLESETARPASTGNRTRKSLIESETQDSKTVKQKK
ncbi:hypothetical protein GCM10010231_64630 [Streptomyces sindenensis]|nr:hypothetical protein GCM10010231_64630 [Streptomyces sindenensis]